jgi:hypothetical protein
MGLSLVEEVQSRHYIESVSGPTTVHISPLRPAFAIAAKSYFAGAAFAAAAGLAAGLAGATRVLRRAWFLTRAMACFFLRTFVLALVLGIFVSGQF